MKPGKISPVLYVVLGVSFGLLGFFLLLANPFGWKLPVPTLTKPPLETINPQTGEVFPEGTAAAPTPYLLLPHGIQTYAVQGLGENTAKVSRVIFDPLDPKINSTQTITVSAIGKEPILSISLTVNTDNLSKIYPMTFTSGTNLKGDWAASFTASDTYEKTYNLSFEIITELGNKSIQPMPIR